MDASRITYQHRLLLEEIKRRMAGHGKWTGLPGLLDELHALRCRYLAASTAQR